MLFFNTEVVDVVGVNYNLKVNNKRNFVSIYRGSWFIGKLNLKNGGIWFVREWKSQFTSRVVRRWHHCERQGIRMVMPIQD